MLYKLANIIHCVFLLFFFCNHKTAYEMRISYWSSDVCSSDLDPPPESGQPAPRQRYRVLAEQPDDAAARPLREIEQPKQRGLARAARAGEEIERAGLEREADVGQRLRAGAVAQPHIFELHDIRHAAPDALGSIADPSRAIARAATRFKRAGAPCARGRVRTRFACRRAYGAVWPYPAFTGNRPPMILECPECHNRYLGPDSAIGDDGRTVRCASCKLGWQSTR